MRGVLHRGAQPTAPARVEVDASASAQPGWAMPAGTRSRSRRTAVAEQKHAGARRARAQELAARERHAAVRLRDEHEVHEGAPAEAPLAARARPERDVTPELGVELVSTGAGARPAHLRAMRTICSARDDRSSGASTARAPGRPADLGASALRRDRRGQGGDRLMRHGSEWPPSRRSAPHPAALGRRRGPLATGGAHRAHPLERIDVSSTGVRADRAAGQPSCSTGASAHPARRRRASSPATPTPNRGAAWTCSSVRR